MSKKSLCKNDIKIDEWFRHFKTLLEQDDVLAGQNSYEDWEDENNQFFNRPITDEEVLLALRNLKPKKAAGPDCIIGEILKHAGLHIIPFFVRFFNVLFDNGVYPDQWTESIIQPLYKKGDANNPGNYRGISLSDTSSKVYGMIINKRIQMWVDENNLTGEQQAGFKSGYSCSDHIFTLMACVQKQFNRVTRRKLYAAFIDFEKCFDTINRNLLWPILLKNGIKGKLFSCIKSMYNSVKARIRCGNALTDKVNCTLGVKQGDICSPVLFSLFINELALEVIRRGRHGINLEDFELFILLLADDVVLLSESIVGLQTQLDSLAYASNSLRLRVNMGKSNIIVFRKGGYLGERERWFFNGTVMPVVNAYKYLGIYFSTKLSFSAACKDLASKAKKALLFVIQRLRHYKNSNFDVFIKIFDTRILPIMQYGSDVWGLDKAAEQCENVHLYALKKFLFVDLKTPNDLVYMELNRYPITINCAINCIRYWLRLIEMESHRMPKKAYKMLKTLDERGKQNWVSKVRECLCQNGFAYVWYSQSVGNKRSFLVLLKQRLIDVRWQNLSEHINNSDRFAFYSQICIHDFITIPLYIRLNINRQLKVLMTRFRFGVTDIYVHSLRYRNVNQNQMNCPFCDDTTENEIHFILCCPMYDNLRERYIPGKFYRNPNANRMNVLLSSTNVDIVGNLCRYIYHALKLREVALS